MLHLCIFLAGGIVFEDQMTGLGSTYTAWLTGWLSGIYCGGGGCVDSSIFAMRRLLLVDVADNIAVFMKITILHKLVFPLSFPLM
jgi:hypothetical protein